ncbi:unnamed protein product [Hyaloperonospora brassicae]|uniref:RxLR effector candidate protein n=1 Tax=Hyaloperonospora brassicae TaxID=162125 RepID=A0AAV0V290_HYABA|nr:unnamed protein product [Hyaloperonospora brassicae]
MGNSLSMCGLGASTDDDDPQLQQTQQQCKASARYVHRSVVSERKHSLSTATDSSVASILSNSEQLIPDAFLPQDIEVLSQRRQRPHRGSMASRSSSSYNYSSGSTGSSRVSNLSSRGVGLVHVVRTLTRAETVPSSVSNKYNFGVKTASCSFGYSDDEGNPAAVSSRRGERPSER